MMRLIFTLIVLATLSGMVCAEGFVEIVVAKIEVLRAPQKNAEVVGVAKFGDVFELVETKGPWHTVYLFMGEPRYVTVKAVKLSGKPTAQIPAGLDEQKIFRESVSAEDKATKYAEQLYPNPKNLDDFKAQTDYGSYLMDGYKLELIHKYKISVEQLKAIQNKGLLKRWPMPSKRRANSSKPRSTTSVERLGALRQMELAFDGGYTQQEIKPLIDEALQLYGLSPTEENYSRAGSTLVALRKQNGTKEMDILNYMIRSHVAGVTVHFADAAALASAALASGEK